MTRNAGSRAPRVLLITRNFPPFRGGMERLNDRMFRHLHALEPGSSLVGPKGSAHYAPMGSEVEEIAAGPLPATVLSSITKGLRMARRTRPDVVLAGSGLTAPAAVLAARAAVAIPAVYLHGLDIVVPSHVYRLAWLPFVRRCHRVLVNSSNTAQLAIKAGVDPARIRVVHPGTELPRQDPTARARFRAKFGLDEATPVLLSVGRLTGRKGLAEFVDKSLPRIVAEHPALRFLIIGDEASDALHRGKGAGIGRVLAAAKLHGIAGAIQWLGPSTEAELADAYQGADLHVFPVRDVPGDVEGFGMVAIEAAAHGLLTVAFDVGGVSDAVVHGITGKLIQAGHYDEFTSAILSTLELDPPQHAAAARAAMDRFSWGRFGHELINALAPMP